MFLYYMLRVLAHISVIQLLFNSYGSTSGVTVGWKSLKWLKIKMNCRLFFEKHIVVLVLDMIYFFKLMISLENYNHQALKL